MFRLCFSCSVFFVLPSNAPMEQTDLLVLRAHDMFHGFHGRVGLETACVASADACSQRQRHPVAASTGDRRPPHRGDAVRPRREVRRGRDHAHPRRGRRRRRSAAAERLDAADAGVGGELALRRLGTGATARCTGTSPSRPNISTKPERSTRCARRSRRGPTSTPPTRPATAPSTTSSTSVSAGNGPPAPT